jgi:hypothetical protein
LIICLNHVHYFAPGLTHAIEEETPVSTDDVLGVHD